MMSHRPTVPFDHLLRRAYRPSPAPARLFEALLRELAEHTQALTGQLRLRDIGTFILRRRGREPIVDVRGEPEAPLADALPDYTGSVDDAVAAAEWHAPAAHHAPLSPPRPARSLTVPITYAGADLGELTLSWRDDLGPDDALAALCREAARRIALLAKRYELRRWTEERLGRPVFFIGTSEGLHGMEAAIERASRVGVPVVIRGEFGTEKAHAALAIHASGPNRNGPLVEVSCTLHPADASARLSQSIAEARGGTLFLNGVDELHPDVQNQLVPLLCSRSGQWVGALGAPDVRIICSTSTDLREMAQEGRFSKSLLADLDFLSVSVPPLRERAADFEPLVTSILEKHGYRADKKRTDALIEICEGHAWPENMIELERTITRLAVATDGPITRGDVAVHAPWLVKGEAAVAASGAVFAKAVAPRPAKPSPSVTDRWVRCVVAKDFTNLGKLHDGMQKALLYLSDHYHEQLSLGQMAKLTHVSPSHLSFLFKTSVGTTFKPFLGRVRVEKAKQILSTEGRQRITEVALNVGFTDLSHFEKLFRRFVGASPRAFRRSTAEPAIHFDA